MNTAELSFQKFCFPELLISEISLVSMNRMKYATASLALVVFVAILMAPVKLGDDLECVAFSF